MKNVALMASGTGTNALNLIEAAKQFPNVRIACLIVDTVDSPLPEMVRQKYPMLPVHRILPMGGLKGQDRKIEHEKRILEALTNHEVNFVFLAGYMKILGQLLLDTFRNRIVNIHPSLLPLYPGMDSYQRAFEDKVTESGVTIHIVDEGVDTGPVLMQEKFPRLDSDTLSDFIQRGKDLEWKLYPKVLAKLNDSATLLPGA
ncbi:MAG: phosphoribosylglycinamide formyltransferase [Bdellovibrionota bacterium]